MGTNLPDAAALKRHVKKQCLPMEIRTYEACGFHIVEHFHEGHKDPHEPEGTYSGSGLGMSAFRRVR